MVETDNPLELADAPSKFGYFAEYRIDPVVDIAEAVQAIQQAVEFRKSV